MNGEFTRVRDAAHASALAAAARWGAAAAAAAWRHSAINRRSMGLREAFAQAPAPARVRWWATVLAVAASTHLVLRWFMSPTVAPATPAALFVAIATAATAIAWRAEAFHRAWDHSWPGRRSRVLRGTRPRKPRTQDPGPRTQDPGPKTQDPDS